jgi:hypothetical protein
LRRAAALINDAVSVGALQTDLEIDGPGSAGSRGHWEQEPAPTRIVDAENVGLVAGEVGSVHDFGHEVVQDPGGLWRMLYSPCPGAGRSGEHKYACQNSGHDDQVS